jgi:hypothetical protein
MPGFCMHAAPVYIAEIAPAKVRGTFVSAKVQIAGNGHGETGGKTGGKTWGKPWENHRKP